MKKKKKVKVEKQGSFDIDIYINEFGELEQNFDIDKINAFLNENTTDWRLQAEESNLAQLQQDEEE